MIKKIYAISGIAIICFLAVSTLTVVVWIGQRSVLKDTTATVDSFPDHDLRPRPRPRPRPIPDPSPSPDSISDLDFRPKPRPKPRPITGGELLLRAAVLNDGLQLRQLVDRLKTAPISYNRITEMWFKKPEDMVLSIDLTSKNVPGLPPGLSGDSTTTRIPVTPIMSAELVGSAGLIIEPTGKQKKRISNVGPTTWQWKVTPTQVDDQYLWLKTYVHISGDPEAEPAELEPSYVDQIKIKVTAWNRVTATVSAVQPVWLFGAGALPALFAMFVWLRQKGWRINSTTATKITNKVRRQSFRRRE